MNEKEHILVVDDEEDILELVRYNLNREGYNVMCAESGEKALSIAEDLTPDLYILDLMLPGIDGLEITKQLKSDPKTASIPVIILSARGEEVDVVTGLELGADDYISKPFSPRVLLARVKAVLRRLKQTSEKQDSDEIVIDDLYIHKGRHVVKVAEKEVKLTYSEFQLLLLLSKRPGWVFTRSRIVDNIRGDNYAVTERSVDVQVVGLRKKLGIYGSYIETVRGIGYRFREV